jgi:hypothetical protein
MRLSVIVSKLTSKILIFAVSSRQPKNLKPSSENVRQINTDLILEEFKKNLI